MVKTLIKTAIGIFSIIIVYFGVLAHKSQKETDTIGLVEGRLRECSNKPNCVCSEQGKSKRWIDPIGYDRNNKAMAWTVFKEVVEDLGGEIKEESDGYLRAIFKTPFFRFVDDVEGRLDDNEQRIHVRSASRVGFYDLGVNRSRVNLITQKVLEQLKEAGRNSQNMTAAPCFLQASRIEFLGLMLVSTGFFGLYTSGNPPRPTFMTASSIESGSWGVKYFSSSKEVSIMIGMASRFSSVGIFFSQPAKSTP